MSGTVPFSPVLPGVSLSVSNAGASGSLNVAIGTVGGTSQATPTPQGYPTFPGGFTLRINNVGTKTAYFNLGTTSSVTAATTDSAIAAGQVINITCNPNVTYLAAICADTDTTTLQATAGEGGV